MRKKTFTTPHEEVEVENWKRTSVYRFRGLTIVLTPDVNVPDLLTPEGDVPDMLRQRWDSAKDFEIALRMYLRSRPFKREPNVLPWEAGAGLNNRQH